MGQKLRVEEYDSTGRLRTIWRLENRGQQFEFCKGNLRWCAIGIPGSVGWQVLAGGRLEIGSHDDH